MLRQAPSLFPLSLSASLQLYFLPAWEVYFSSTNTIGNIKESGLGSENQPYGSGGRKVLRTIDLLEVYVKDEDQSKKKMGSFVSLG